MCVSIFTLCQWPPCGQHYTTFNPLDKDIHTIERLPAVTRPPSGLLSSGFSLPLGFSLSSFKKNSGPTQHQTFDSALLLCFQVIQDYDLFFGTVTPKKKPSPTLHAVADGVTQGMTDCV